MGEETDIGSQSVGGQVNAGVMTCLDISREPTPNVGCKTGRHFEFPVRGYLFRDLKKLGKVPNVETVSRTEFPLAALETFQQPWP